MTAVAADVDVLSDLDFQPSLPCELQSHDRLDAGNLPAVWRAFGWCPGCHYRVDFLLCEPGRLRKQSSMSGCTRCGHTHWWADTFTVVPI